MTKPLSIADVSTAILQSVLASPKRQRRLRSKTFWAMFGIKARTKDRIEAIKATLKGQGLLLNLDDSHFGTEAKDDWVILSFVEPNLAPSMPTGSGSKAQPAEGMPSEGWFQLMEGRKFESEREVEYYFILPLLESLGYEEDDFAIGYPIEMYEGVNKVKKEADFAVFNGESREKTHALLIVEAKKAGKSLTKEAVGQAKGYAVWLTAPFYLVTNAEDVELYLYRAGLQPDVRLMKFSRCALRQSWGELYQHINKAAVIERKNKLREIFATNGI